MARVESYTAEHIDGVIQTLTQQLANLQITVNGKADSSQIAADLAALVGSSPEALNTLDEIANALQDNPNVISEMLTTIGLRATKVEFDTHTGSFTAHGATSANTNDRIVLRLGDGGINISYATLVTTQSVASPPAASRAVRRDFMDASITARVVGLFPDGEFRLRAPNTVEASTLPTPQHKDVYFRVVPE